MEPITLSLLAQFAPSLIKWVTGNDKAEEITQAVVDVAKEVTGTGTAKSAVATLQADPEAVLRFQQAIAEREAELEKAYLADVDSARKMQIAALNQDDIFSKRFIYYFALGWSLFAAVYFTGTTFIEIPASGQRVADTILGVLVGTVMSGLFGFFYGSSARSASKDDLIHKLSTKP